MNHLGRLALSLILAGSLACRQPLDRPHCRPLQVESSGWRADWYYLERSPSPRAVQVFDTAGRLVQQTFYRYHNHLLVERETRAANGQPLERVRFDHDEAGRVNLRERWPQRSGNFDESYARERRTYDAAGRLRERIWQIDRATTSLTARTERLYYDAANRLVASEIYRENRHDTAAILYRFEFEWTDIPNILADFWADDPTWALAEQLPAQIRAYFPQGRLDSVASFDFTYKLDADGLPIQVSQKALRGPDKSWRFRYSCR